MIPKAVDNKTYFMLGLMSMWIFTTVVLHRLANPVLSVMIHLGTTVLNEGTLSICHLLSVFCYLNYHHS